MKFLDLRSDTVTLPTREMKSFMFDAPVGDDVFGEDPTVKNLEQKCADLFGMEAGLFFPSGTMSNQVAIKAQTSPLDEIICDKLSHIYNYETGGWAFHSGVSVRLTDCSRGIMTPESVESCILPDKDWFPNTRLVCIENTVNKGGGSCYSLSEMKEISELCKSKGLLLHLDGARIFNGLLSKNIKPIQLKGLFNSISICLSKGLGAPAGSVLISDSLTIKKSRKIRKVMGGGMRQAGLLAAAGIYALDHHVERLKEDHDNALKIGGILNKCSWVKGILPIESNIVIFEVEDSQITESKLRELGIGCSPFSPTQVRMVTHLNFNEITELESRLNQTLV